MKIVRQPKPSSRPRLQTHVRAGEVGAVAQESRRIYSQTSAAVIQNTAEDANRMYGG